MDAMLKRGVVVQPEFILDEIEKAIEKDKGILFPGWFAKTITTSYKFFPNFTGNLVNKIG